MDCNTDSESEWGRRGAVGLVWSCVASSDQAIFWRFVDQIYYLLRCEESCKKFKNFVYQISSWDFILLNLGN